MTDPAPLPRHPRQGPANPVISTPTRRPGSVRRTITIDALRPDGLDGPLRLIGRGRDIRTEADGSATTLDAVTTYVDIDYAGDHTVSAVATEPPSSSAAGLAGSNASAGFRRALEAALGADRGGLLYQLLDDVPVSTLVSGYALTASGRWKMEDAGLGLQAADLCAGWATEATIIYEIRTKGRIPSVVGPATPPLVAPEDPSGWHEIPALPPHGMRRHRRLDVWEADGGVQVDSFFRDSHVNDRGDPTVVHEYAVRATVDADAQHFVSVEADPRSLPWLECPEAAASAGRLGGAPVGGVRERVRKDFTGPSTCTHLNDTLRSLEDVPHLLAALRGSG